MENQLIEKAVGQIDDLVKQNLDLSKKLEDVNKKMFNLDQKFIERTAADSEEAKHYGFLQAREDYQKGKTADVPYWDNYTKKRFLNFAQMYFQKDFAGIQKAFETNLQDNVSNWIPIEFVPELVRLVFVQSTMLKYVTIVPMMRDIMHLPMPTPTTDTYAYHADSWYTVRFIDRGEALVSEKFLPNKLVLTSAKIGAVALVNREDLMDPAYPLASYIAQQLAEDMAKMIDKTIFYSNSAAVTAGDPVWNCANWDGLAVKSGVNAVTGAATASPTFAGLMTYANLATALGYLNELTAEGAKWFMSSGAYAAARTQVASFPTYNGTTTGTLLGASTLPLIPISADYKSPIFGYPVEICDRLVITPAVSTMAAFLGNPKYIYFGDRMQFGVDVSEHYRFANDQVTFRALQRFAVGIGRPYAYTKISWGAAS